DAFHHEVDLARRQVALAHDRPGADLLLERDEVGFRLAGQADEDEGGEVEAERLFVEQCAVASDEAGLFQGADPAEARRRRDAYPAGQLDVGHAAVVLQLVQDLPVDGVQAGFQSSASLTIYALTAVLGWQRYRILAR